MYWLTGILGIVFLIAPYILGYATNTAALWTSLAIGGIVTLVSIMEAVASDKDTWEYWTAEILGLVAIAAPFIFGFNTHATAMWTSVVIGILLSLMAGSRLYVGKTG